MPVTVRLASPFVKYTSGSEVVLAHSGTLKDIISELTKQYSGLADALLTNDALKDYIALYVNDAFADLSTYAKDGDEICIVPIVIGG